MWPTGEKSIKMGFFGVGAALEVTSGRLYIPFPFVILYPFSFS
jgi:hypothetical protein